jgi:hypothetical protein
LKCQEKTTTHRGYDHVVRASGKARKHGEKPKSIDGPDLPNCQEAKISGFSDLFQSRYYGGEYYNKNMSSSVSLNNISVFLIRIAN